MTNSPKMKRSFM